MQIQEALQFIDNVLGQVSGTRADHIKIQDAIATVQAFVRDHQGTEALDLGPADTETE